VSRIALIVNLLENINVFLIYVYVYISISDRQYCVATGKSYMMQTILGIPADICYRNLP